MDLESKALFAKCGQLESFLLAHRVILLHLLRLEAEDATEPMTRLGEMKASLLATLDAMQLRGMNAGTRDLLRNGARIELETVLVDVGTAVRDRTAAPPDPTRKH